jgi:hypothetical protein
MVLDKPRLRVREADFERLLDLLMKDFKIDDRATLKSHVEVATRIYNHNPDKLSDRDRERLVKFGPKLAGLLRKNAIPIVNIITAFDQQHVRGFEPEFCKSIYDQGEADAFSKGLPVKSPGLSEGRRVGALIMVAHPMRRPHRYRRPNPDRHRALELLAGSRQGCNQGDDAGTRLLDRHAGRTGQGRTRDHEARAHGRRRSTDRRCTRADHGSGPASAPR